MAGQILQVPLSKKQQRSQTVQNFIQYLTEFYDGFESQANILQGYYPKHIQKCIQKKKSQNAERIAQSIKVPSFFNGGSSSKLSQKQMKSKAKKALHKMNLLTKFQATMMQVVLQKIDRRSKPIRKQTKIVTNSLNKK
jgi:fructose/tagatose bisphosphate aldolase